MKHLVNNLSDIVHNIIVSTIKHSVQLNHLVVDVLDPSYQVIHILVEFLLKLLRA